LRRGCRFSIFEKTIRFWPAWRGSCSFSHKTYLRLFFTGYLCSGDIDAARGELNFQTSGYVSDGSALSVGKFLGAMAVIAGSVSGIRESA
jgi:hypothetical protein